MTLGLILHIYLQHSADSGFINMQLANTNKDVAFAYLVYYGSMFLQGRLY